jgi:hypothetical protein
MKPYKNQFKINKNSNTRGTLGRLLEEKDNPVTKSCDLLAVLQESFEILHKMIRDISLSSVFRQILNSCSKLLSSKTPAQK